MFRILTKIHFKYKVYCCQIFIDYALFQIYTNWKIFNKVHGRTILYETILFLLLSQPLSTLI